MTYAKLNTDGTLTYYRQPLRTETRDIFTTDSAILAEFGYFPLRYTDEPEADEYHTAVPHWEQGEGEIVQVWEVEEIPYDPEEITDTEALLLIAEGEE